MADSLVESNQRLAPNRLGVVEWSGEGLPNLEEWRHATSSAAPAVPSISIRLKPEIASLPTEVHEGGPHRFLSGSLSLLDLALIPVFEGLPRPTSPSLLARDVFACGRLDGTGRSGSGAERGPSSGPERLRDLQQEYGPVLRLAPLTQSRRRTLAQAAIQFAVRWPWVHTALVPLPTADRMDEVLQSLDRPPLTDEELRRALPEGPGS